MNKVGSHQLSESQHKALLAPEARLLVSAGAGSGKTRLLVAHLVRVLAEAGTPPDKVVAVTFTRAAAAEIASRTRQELVERGRPDLARELDSATIGTIHSLCLKLIREHALLLGVDPGWSVAEEQEAAILKEKALQLAWEQLVTEADEETLELMAAENQLLAREALYLYDRVRTLGSENPQVSMSCQTSLGEAQARLVAAIEQALTLESKAKEGSHLAKDLAVLRECLLWLSGRHLDEDPEEMLVTAARFFPSRRTRSAEHLFGPVRDALFRYRCALAEQCLRPIGVVMNLLLAHLHAHYQALKRARKVLDFNDLELYAKKLVELGEKGLLPGPLLPGGVVLVDEFQDTNELQCRILEGLGASRIILVGDERQSIYRFRGADVTVFRRRRRLFAENSGATGGQAVVTLDENYRSTPQILAFVNKVFSSPAFFGNESEEGSAFVPLRVANPDYAGRPVEILLAERVVEGDGGGELEDQGVQDLSIQQAEAEVIADRVFQLVTREGWRCADVAVLLPAYTTVEIYQQALLSRGLPVYLARGRRFYSRQEIVDIACFLRILANRHDDVALAAVLRSPMVGVSDDALFVLGQEHRGRRRGEPGSLWTAMSIVLGSGCAELGEEDARRLRVFWDRYHELRRRVGQVGLAHLVEQVLTTCDYDLYLLAGPEGKRRYANVRKLMRIADAYESFEGPDLAGFASVLKARAETDDKEPEAPTLAKDEDVVQVTTVHQAKGLEFPCVVVGGLGSKEPRDATRRFAVADDGRVAVFMRKSLADKNEPCSPCWGPGQEIERENRQKDTEEDKRLLYVAMTRAMKHLILVGAVHAGRKSGSRIQRILEALGVDQVENREHPLALEDPPVSVALVQPKPPGAAPSSVKVTGKSENQLELPRLPEPLTEVFQPREVSFSALALYQSCARRFYLERVLGLSRSGMGGIFSAEQDDGDLQTQEVVADSLERESGLVTGLQVHALLQRFGNAADPPARDLMEEAARAWLAQFGYAASTVDFERAVRLALAFWESPVQRWVSGRACLQEVPFTFEHEGIIVSGVIDLLARDPDGWYLVDYKTNRLDGRSVADVMPHYKLQGQIYALAALKAGACQVKMAFLFLERAQDPVVESYTQAQVTQLEEVLSRALAGITKGEYLPSPGSQCAVCPVRSLCQ